jgi:trehalose 6-phosphate synthase/phosphatase
MEIRQHYQASRKRLLLLDYDGTLVDFTPDPANARPTAAALQILTELADDPPNTVAVVSGRDCQFMEGALGHLPIDLVAEHGLYIRRPGADWRATAPLNQDWKPAVRRVLEAAQLPGSFIEEKSMGLVWHYRQCAPEAAQTAVKRLLTDLQMLPDAGLKVMDGSKVIEVSAADADKGRAARGLLAEGDYDFVLAAGDDTTDEDLFQALPSTAHKIKVGEPILSANANVTDPAGLLELLRDLCH